MLSKINHLAAIGAAVVYFLWGGLWFGVFFGSTWQALTGKTMSAGPGTYAISFLMDLITAYAIAIALRDSESPNMVRHGIAFGIFIGVGFVLTGMLSQTVYESRPLGLWLIDGIYTVGGFAIMGAIVGGWRARA